MNKALKVVAIAQTANLGDVVSCLPMAAVLKEHFPGVKVLFVARNYARALIEACRYSDGFIDCREAVATPAVLREREVDVLVNPFLVDDLGFAAQAAGVPVRIGNLRRPRTMKWANRFIYMGSQTNPLHIANMNLRHLRPLGIHVELTHAQLAERLGVEPTVALRDDLAALLRPDRFNLILHPKSNKNGREWPATHFNRLVDLLPAERFRIIVTGVAAEREELLRECPALIQRDRIVDLMGRLELEQFIALTRAADGLVGNSTGPLHISAAVGTPTLGVFPGRHLANARKWGPIGVRAETYSFRETCEPGPGRCPFRYAGEGCSCMTGIDPGAVAERVLRWERAWAANTEAGFEEAAA
jgi:ADP-heptose:LPS heptosyltransferase